MLELIGIDVYEILEDVLKWLNKQKVEVLKSELLEDFDNKLDHVLDKIEEIEFLNYGNYFDALPLGDNLILEATSVMSINPLLISLDDDFTKSDLFDEIASKFSILTGLFVDGDELKDLFDNLCEIIDQDITLQIPGNNILLDTTEIEEIVAGWDDLNKITSSDISNINNLIFNLEGIDGISTNDIRDKINSVIQSIGGLESIFAPIFEELLYFLAENDPWFASRTNYDISILIALIIDIFCILLDVLDALNWFPDLGILDEIITLVMGIIIGYCGYNAKIKTDDTYKGKNAEYIQSIGAFISVQAYFELRAQIYYGDLIADKFGSIIEIILDIISVCSTYWHFYEQGDVDWDAVLWAIIDGVITFPDAVLPLIKDNKKALVICIVACAIGITFLIIRLTNPGRWI